MKYIYYNKKLRCQITHDKDKATMRLRLQFRNGWWIGWVSYSKFVEITLQKIDLGTPNLFPKTFKYDNGGHLEIWDEPSFNLNERVQEIFADYLSSVERKEFANKRIEAMM